MRKLLVVCPYPEHKAPSQRLKYEQYFSYFRENGYEITVRPFMSEKFWNIAYKPGNLFRKAWLLIRAYLSRFGLLFQIPNYDVVYIHLWVTPFGPPIFEWLVRKLAKKIVFDIDDLVYLKNEKSGKWYVNLVKGRQKPIYLMQKSNHVITCTPFLDNFVRKYNSETTDISSTINTETYQPVNSYSSESIVQLGWSGSHSTIRYLKLLTPVLQKLREKRNFRLIVMGDATFKLEGIEVDAYEWSEKLEIPVLQKIDIGLYPLPLDEQWVYGKSGLKALQYMALGIPTIATAIGANFRVIEHEVSGFLVTTPDEWLEKLCALLDDASLRKSLGTRARERVEKYYSIHANAPVYLNILNKVVESK